MQTNNNEQSVLPTIAVIGGTGAIGRGLVKRLAKASYPLVIGSRSEERATSIAVDLSAVYPNIQAQGTDNLHACQAAQIIFLAVPFKGQLDTLKEIQPALNDQLLVDVTVPLQPPKVGTVQMPDCGSAALQAQAFLGEDFPLVSAFQNVSAAHLNGDHDIDCDVLVTGNKRADREKVIQLVSAMGMRGWHAGPLANSVATEALTSVLISINRHHDIDGAGLRITGQKKSE